MGLGHWEIILIVVIVLIIFGAGKLPTVFRSLGEGVREMKNAMEGKVDDSQKEKEKSNKNDEKASR